MIASIPTLGRKEFRTHQEVRLAHRDEFDAIIEDEAHIGMADSFKRVYDHFGLLDRSRSKTLFLGITATPNRNDGQGLKALFDEIVFDMGIRQGIETELALRHPGDARVRPRRISPM